MVDVNKLLPELTLDEKITLLAGRTTWETPPIERLGIPSLKVTDGPNGARGSSFYEGITAACFPACVSLAATFDRSLARRVGAALAQEARTKGAHVLLGPTVCIHRSPLGGRNFESFSEDPFLTGSLAAQYVAGVQQQQQQQQQQSEKVAATVKHFVANEQETRRFTVDQKISERALREIYLRPFEIIVKQADPWCIMTSYPRINGAYVDAQPALVRDVLRAQWGYEGLVMSDWASCTNHVESINYGLDLEMPGPPKRRTVENVKRAVEDGLVQVEDIDKRVAAFLKLLVKTGKFSDRQDSPPEEQAVDLPEHRALIREAGGEGIVLLKNDNKTLPIDPKSVKKIAVVGPLAKDAAAHGGGSASLKCHYKISPFDALKERLGERVEVAYSKGAHIFRTYPDLEAGAQTEDGKAGFTGEYFNTTDFSGEPFYKDHFQRAFLTNLMVEGAAGAKSARYSTRYTPPEAGNHHLSFSGAGPCKLFIDGELVSHQETQLKDAMRYFLGSQEEHRFRYRFEPSRTYEIVVETVPSPFENAELHLMLGIVSAHIGFVTEAEMAPDLLAEAVALARDADVVICCVGNTTQWETEGQDLATMSLPDETRSQDRLVAAVAGANSRTVVVNATGVPVEMPWLDAVPAVMQAWYAGQETGNAIADVLLGEVSPGGKLPVSWPRRYEDTACYGHFGLDSFKSAKVEYVEGVFVGYRHFDRHYGSDKEVLFPFGFGLSFAEFAVTDCRIVKSNIGPPNSIDDGGNRDGVSVSATVQNTSTIAGAETVQVYLSPPRQSTAERPPKSLVAFDKMFLQPGEKKELLLEFGRDGAAYWDSGRNMWAVEEGEHIVTVATSSHPRDVKCRLTLHIGSHFTFAP